MSNIKDILSPMGAEVSIIPVMQGDGTMKVNETELPDSNLVKFMREGYMAPGLESDGRDGVFFIFGRADNVDPLTFPAVTSMQKAFHRILRSGRRLRSGTIFFLTDRLDRFGTQYYRNQERQSGESGR